MPYRERKVSFNGLIGIGIRLEFESFGSLGTSTDLFIKNQSLQKLGEMSLGRAVNRVNPSDPIALVSLNNSPLYIGFDGEIIALSESCSENRLEVKLRFFVP